MKNLVAFSYIERTGPDVAGVAVETHIRRCVLAPAPIDTVRLKFRLGNIPAKHVTRQPGNSAIPSKS